MGTPIFGNVRLPNISWTLKKRVSIRNLRVIHDRVDDQGRDHFQKSTNELSQKTGPSINYSGMYHRVMNRVYPIYRLDMAKKWSNRGGTNSGTTVRTVGTRPWTLPKFRHFVHGRTSRRTTIHVGVL